MSIILFIIILFILVLVHEFGHFITAKRFGIRVDEFGFGFPPRAAKLFTKGETAYTLNWIPFGGFVKIFGENPDEASLTGPGSERSFARKPWYVQAAVLVAGVLFNAVFAWMLFSIGFMSGLPTSVGAEPEGSVVMNQHLTITSLKAGAPAAVAGLKAGDRILKIETKDAKNSEDAPTAESLKSFIAKYGEAPIEISYERGHEEKSVEVLAKSGVLSDSGRGIGISMDTIGTLKLPFFQAFFEGGKLSLHLIRGTFLGFYNLIAGAIRGTGDLSSVTGPIGIVGFVKDAYEFGFVYLLSFTALISINLAVINLIPFPALDGGRLLFVAIEAITRKQIPPKVANMANTIGFFILIALMLLVTAHDVWKFF